MQPSFDTWTSIFLFAAIQGLFVALALLLTGERHNSGRALLAVIILLFSITLTEYVLWWTSYIVRFPHLMNISFCFPFLYGPLLYCYFLYVFENRKPGALHLLALLPFVINVAFMLDFYFESAEWKQQILTGKTGMRRPVLPWHWLKAAHLTIYAIVIIRCFYPQSRAQHDVKVWFNYLTVFYIAFVLSYTSYYIMVLFPWFNLSWDYMISFSMMFFIFFIAWFGYLQPAVFKGFSVSEVIKENFTRKKYEHSPLTDDISDEILRKMEIVMQKDKLYRENELRLETLAAAVGTGKHLLSQVINEKTGMRFFEYVNSLRVQEAQLLLTDKSKVELNISEIAYSVGFNNKVSFNSTFKKSTGMTPTEFRKKHASATASMN